MKGLYAPNVPISGTGVAVAGPAGLVGCLVLTVHSTALRFALGGLLLVAMLGALYLLNRRLDRGRPTRNQRHEALLAQTDDTLRLVERHVAELDAATDALVASVAKARA